MMLCSCGRWMFRRYISDQSGTTCYYYDYCEGHQANGFDDYGNPMHYYYG